MIKDNLEENFWFKLDLIVFRAFFLTFLALFIVDYFLPGFVTDYFNPIWLLIISIITGIIAITKKE